MATKIGGGGGGRGDNNILTFCPTVPDKKMALAKCLFIFTRVCLFIKLEKLHFGQFLSICICKVS